MNPSGTSRIEKKVVIRAPRGRVWRAITDIGEFSRRFGVEAGGVFERGARLRMVSTNEGGWKHQTMALEQYAGKAA